MSTKHPIQTTTNTTLPKTSLPPSHTFDILPALHELLARIDPENHSSLNNNPTLFPTLQHNPSDPSDLSESDIGSHYPADTLLPLLPKDLPEEVLKTIRARIRAAVRAVEALPDVERSVEDQEEEIGRLEERVRRQREILRGLGDVVEGVKGRVGE